MRSLDTIQDPDTLRSFAVLLQKENDRLHRRMQDLVREIAALRGHSEAGRLQLELEGLREQMVKMQRRLFAESSEKRPSDDRTDRTAGASRAWSAGAASVADGGADS